jgi:hypothetical protein
MSYATPTHIQICRGAGDAHILTHTPQKKNLVVLRKRAGGFLSQTDFLCLCFCLCVFVVCVRGQCTVVLGELACLLQGVCVHT